MTLFLGRHFNWQPSECDDMDLEELRKFFQVARTFLKAERDAQ